MTEPPTPGTEEPETAPPAAPTTSWLSDIWARIKEHKVMQWTLAYAAAAYTLLHGGEMLSDAQEWPHAIIRVFSLLLVLGVPVVITIAWYHGTKGMSKVSGPELTIITLLGIIAGSALWALSRTGNGHVNAAAAATTAAVAPTAKTAASNAPRTAIAVMPFENQTGDMRKAYLGEGMATELINTLSKVPGLKIPARTSSFAYRGRNVDARQIAQDLGVGTLLEGAVQVSGNRIRVTADLVNAADGLHLWSETYERKFTDLFRLQDDVTKAIVAALPRYMNVGPIARPQTTRPTQNQEAYELYLQGTSLIDRISLDQAHRFFTQAVAKDPSFALAYAGLADTEAGYSQVSQLTYEHVRAAEAAAQKAISLDPSIGEAHYVLAFVSEMHGRLLEMASHDRAAIALSPDDAFARSIVAVHLAGVGHLRQALELAQSAYQIAPAKPITSLMLAAVQWQSGQYGAAEASANRSAALGIPATAKPLPDLLAEIAMRDGRLADSRAASIHAVDPRDTDNTRVGDVIGLIYAVAADTSQRRTLLTGVDSLYPAGSGTRTKDSMAAAANCMRVAFGLARVGEVDRSYDIANLCLDRMVAPVIVPEWDPFWVWSPEMRPFRQNRRFQAYATRLGLMDYWQQYGSPDECDLKGGKLTCH